MQQNRITAPRLADLLLDEVEAHDAPDMLPDGRDEEDRAAFFSLSLDEMSR